MGFRRAPGWKNSESPVCGIWKQDLLIYLGKLFDIKVLIETGTCEGSTPAAVYDYFDKIYTIEASEYYYEFSKKRLSEELNIACREYKKQDTGQKVSRIGKILMYLGDSGIELERILSAAEEVPALFWLDAHPSNELTANSYKPLAKELAVITKQRSNPLIVIDDEPDASLINLGLDLDALGYIRDYRTGEVILTKANSGYFIPPFEY